MGKMTSIYLTDEEATELKKFCEENQCTQYSALKSALKELLSKPPQESEQEIPVQESIQQDPSPEPETSSSTRQPKKQLRILQKIAEELRTQQS